MHKILLIGNVGKDPEVKEFENGGKIAIFNVADTERGFKTKDGKEIPNHTEWFTCKVLQPGLAEVVKQYIKKGSKVGVCGKFKTREYEKEGRKYEIKELLVETLELLSPKEEKGSSGSQTQNQDNVQQTHHMQEQKDDLPF